MVDNGTSLMEKHVVLFDLSDQSYGIDISSVQEIIRMQPTMKIPDAPNFVEGVIRLRDKVIPVVDLRKIFNLALKEETNNSRIIIVDIHGKSTGIIVDEATDVSRIPADVLELTTDTTTAIDPDCVTGIAKLSDNMVVLLNLEKILSVKSSNHSSETVLTGTNVIVEKPEPEQETSSATVVVETEAGLEPVSIAPEGNGKDSEAVEDNFTPEATLDTISVEAGDSFSDISLDTIIETEKTSTLLEDDSTSEPAPEIDTIEAEDSLSEMLSKTTVENSQIETKDEHTIEETGESETPEGREVEAIQTEFDQPMMDIVNVGMNNAISGLSGMMCQQMEVTDIGLKKIAVKDVPDLFGGAEAMVVGIYLEISGDANGQMIVIYQPEVAYNLIDVLMGQALGTTSSLDELEVSALGEMGNIMGSYFLNSLADHAGVSLQPSPPAVMVDMAGAILDIALWQVMQENDNTFIAESSFKSCDTEINGQFLVLLSHSLLSILQPEEHCSQAAAIM